jgi:hypothetical protein
MSPALFFFTNYLFRLGSHVFAEDQPIRDGTTMPNLLVEVGGGLTNFLSRLTSNLEILQVAGITDMSHCAQAPLLHLLSTLQTKEGDGSMKGEES